MAQDETRLVVLRTSIQNWKNVNKKMDITSNCHYSNPTCADSVLSGYKSSNQEINNETQVHRFQQLQYSSEL